MDLEENFKKSFMYPLCDYNKFALLGVLSVFTLLGLILHSFEIDDFTIVVIFGLIGFVISLYLTGYFVSIIKNGMHVKEEIPDFEISRDILNFFKYLFVSIVYAVIPTIILLIVFSGSGLINTLIQILGCYIDATSIPDTLLSSFTFSVSVVLVVSIIVLVIQSIFTNVAIARMVANDSLSEGLDFAEVFHDIGKIGWFKILLWFILICLVNVLFYLIMTGITFIPYVGIIIAGFFMLNFMRMFNAYSVGLLYSDVYEINNGIRETNIETEISDKKEMDDENNE